MGRSYDFDADAECEQCGALGAFDFYGDMLCPECLRKQTRAAGIRQDMPIAFRAPEQEEDDEGDPIF